MLARANVSVCNTAWHHVTHAESCLSNSRWANIDSCLPLLDSPCADYADDSLKLWASLGA